MNRETHNKQQAEDDNTHMQLSYISREKLY